MRRRGFNSGHSTTITRASVRGGFSRGIRRLNSSGGSVARASTEAGCLMESKARATTSDTPPTGLKARTQRSVDPREPRAGPRRWSLRSRDLWKGCPCGKPGRTRMSFWPASRSQVVPSSAVSARCACARAPTVCSACREPLVHAPRTHREPEIYRHA